MVDQEISQHRAAEGSDERCHHRVSQGRAPLSQNRKCERFWTLPHLDRVVRGTVEETLNALLDAEADRLCKVKFFLNASTASLGQDGFTPPCRPRSTDPIDLS